MNEKIERECSVCNKHFKPMTEKQWKVVKYEHETISTRHEKYLELER
ncbi:MAG: hypothetical protein AB1468_04285 [Candidatus Micrarchaeota archaeon]